MAAAHVLDHGTFTAAAASGSDTVAAAANIPVGNFVVGVCFHSSGGVLTMSDTHANAYTTRLKIANGTNPEFSIAAAKVTTQINTGDLITFAYTLNPTYKQLHLLEFSGVDDILDIATPAGATGTSTAPSAAQTTLTAGDLLVGGVNWNLTTPTTDVASPGAGWTKSFTTQDTFTTVHRLTSLWKIGGAAGSENIAGTLPASAPWAEAFVAFKATPGAAATARARPTILTQAVQRSVTRCQRLTRRRSGLFVPAAWAERIVVPEVA